MSGPTWQPSNNPYESPKPVQGGDESFGGGPWDMDYFGGIKLIQSNPNWLTNAFMSGLCGLIPIVGQIVLMGYAYETAELLHRTNGKIYWDFNFNRFGDYLTRGLGPFLIGLVFGILQFFLNFGIQIGTTLLLAALAGQQQQQGGPTAMDGMAVAAILLSNLFSFGAQILLSFIYYPLQIRGGLANEVGQSFQFNFAFDFAGKLWMEIVLVALVSTLLGMGVVALAIVTCCIGLIPAIGFMSLMNGWFGFQLYRKYLSKGGRPIPLKPLPVQPKV